ncbi:MAG: ABC transporter permease [Beijerinckiaceae bacterium]|nr:ABC transporter permease [Beijerinckiaceae bacterium]
MSERFIDTPRGRMGESLLLQGRVIRALMLRQALSRFGHDNLGVFWIFAEPLLLAGAVMLMWTVAGLNKGHGVGIVPFVLASYSLLTLWRGTCSASIRALRANADLLYHRNLRLLDILIARIALDSLSGFAAFTVAYIVLNLFGAVRDVDDALVMAGGWLLLTWFGWSFGLIVSALTELFEPAEHFVPPFLYITLPMTGAFYMVLWMPPSVQEVVMWSPIVHIFEMFRGGMFGQQYAADWSVMYVAGWCVAQMAIGLPLLRLAQHRYTTG